MSVHDGNGWTRCGRGHRHWGKHGAAGLLVSAPAGDGTGGGTGDLLVLLAQRSWWGSYGGAWGPPGGARDSHESPVSAALREAAEECALDPSAVRAHGIWNEDHGGWTYRTVLATAAEPVPVAPVSEETSEVAWVPASSVERLELHPGFEAQWPSLRGALSPPVVIVDVANVMGSRPDGWWRDRAGAARRLCEEIGALGVRGVPELPEQLRLPALEWWFPRFVAVVEGVAARAPEVSAAGSDALQVVRAAGSGDDEIARQAAGTCGPRLVVTADRELRGRCEAAGACVTGPSWLLGQIGAERPGSRSG